MILPRSRPGPSTLARGSVVADLVAYAEIDRVEVIDEARARGRCRAIRRPLAPPLRAPSRLEVVRVTDLQS